MLAELKPKAAANLILTGQQESLATVAKHIKSCKLYFTINGIIRCD
jgi:hypothetical protein